MKQIDNLLIFLVDDDIMFLRSLEHSIHQFFKNSKVVSFSTGEECLNNMYQKPDIILLDYKLNGNYPKAMDGLKVLDKVKSAEPEIPVIMFSGQDHMDVAIDTMKHGAFDYIVKNERLFVRVQNGIKNVLHRFALQEDMDEYKFKTKISMLILTLIFAGVMYLQTHFRIFM